MKKKDTLLTIIIGKLLNFPPNIILPCSHVGVSFPLFIIVLMLMTVIVVLCIVTTRHRRSKNLSEDNDKIKVDIPNKSSQVTVPNEPMYAEIIDKESKNAIVDVATGKYTYHITTNTSYNTVILHNMNPSTVVLHDNTGKISTYIIRDNL